MCLAAAKEISCYLYRQWSEPQAHLPITLGSLQMTGWFAMCGSKDCQRTLGNCLKTQPVSYIFMINLVSIPSGKRMSMTLKKKRKRKRFMYLIETGFNLMPLDQLLEFFIYVNEILRVVAYCYSVVVPSYWTQRLRLPLDRILNKIINLNGKLEKELWMEQRWNSNLHQRQ